jgi:hypothetical protein
MRADQNQKSNILVTKLLYSATKEGAQDVL